LSRLHERDNGHNSVIGGGHVTVVVKRYAMILSNISLDRSSSMEY
jgi:hypothetical protein